MDIYLAEPRGFCAGVRRAIAIVENALEQYGAPIYVRHEIVHRALSRWIGICPGKDRLLRLQKYNGGRQRAMAEGYLL